MYYSWLFDNETVTVVTCDIAAGVGEGDFADFVGVEPDLSFSAFED